MAEFNGQIGDLTDIESPWGNAGGVVKTLEDVESMAQTGVGWIEAGSYTLPMRLGNGPNGETVYYYNVETGETYNSLGMPNKGFDVVETEIPEMVRIAEAYGKKLIVNVAPVSEEPVAETQELVSRAYAAGAHKVLVNAGCPNVVVGDGDRHEVLSYNPQSLGLVLAGLEVIVAKYRPVAVRLSPYETKQAMAQAVRPMLEDYGTVDSIFGPNTWGGNKPLDKNGAPILQVPKNIGGKSGPAMADAAAEQTSWTVELVKGSHIDVVSSSGVMNASELQRRLDIGAVAAAGTTFFYESLNGWKQDTERLLTELAA